MFIDDYKYIKEEPKVFDVADGDHTVRVKDCKLETSKQNKRMIKMILEVQGANGVPYNHFLVEGDYFDSMSSRVFDAFKIPQGNFNFSGWLGKTALAHFAHKEEEFTGKDGMKKKVNKARLVYFHTGNKEVPAAVQKVTEAVGGSAEEFEEDIFF